MRIHREGRSTILLVLFIVLSVCITLWIWNPMILINSLVSVCLSLSLLFVLRFFRYPYRPNTADKGVVLSPSDGKVVEIIKETEQEYFGDDRIRISVFMSGFNVHANWVPLTGVVQHSKYHPGRNLFAIHPKSSQLNERSSVVIRDSFNNEILVRQIAGIFARRVVTYPRSGDKIKQGDELGFIKFGSRMDIFVPLNAEILVNLDVKVIGNVTEIARF